MNGYRSKLSTTYRDDVTSGPIKTDRAHDKGLEIELSYRLTNRRKLLLKRDGGVGSGGIFLQQNVAAKIGLTGVSLCLYESGGQFPSTFARWQRWARALGGTLTISLELPEVDDG